MGAVPISFELDAATLDAAVEKFGAAAEQAVQQTMRELQEMRREQASSLVIPDAAGAALPNPSDLLGADGRGAKHRGAQDSERVPARIGALEFHRQAPAGAAARRWRAPGPL